MSTPARGEIWFVSLDPTTEREQARIGRFSQRFQRGPGGTGGGLAYNFEGEKNTVPHYYPAAGRRFIFEQFC